MKNIRRKSAQYLYTVHIFMYFEIIIAGYEKILIAKKSDQIIIQTKYIHRYENNTYLFCPII